MNLNAAELAALRAIADGRVPADEKLRAQLKRKGLIARGLFGDRAYYLTAIGRELLGREA